MRSTTSLRSFPNVAFETVPMFVLLTMVLSRPFKEDRRALPLSVPLLQAVDGVMSLALCLQAVSQAPQHFISSNTQCICEGCSANQSICSVSFFHCNTSKAVHRQKFSKVDVDHRHIPVQLCPSLIRLMISVDVNHNERRKKGSPWHIIMHSME